MSVKKNAQTKQAKAPARKGGKKAPPTRPPKRREIGSFVCFVMGILSFLAYFTSTGWLIHGLRQLISGLFGTGFFLVAPVLFFLSFILAFHRGRPVRLRVASAIVIPILIGGLLHLFANNTEGETVGIRAGELWESGQAMMSGGVISGFLADLLRSMVSVVGAVALIVIALFFAGLTAVNRSIVEIFDWFKNREQYQYEAEPEPDFGQEAAARGEKRIAHPMDPALMQTAPRARKKAVIDIPMDGDAPPVQVQAEEKKERKIGLRKPGALTPDQVLANLEETETKAEVTEEAPPKPRSPFSRAYDIPVSADESLEHIDHGPSVPNLTNFQKKTEAAVPVNPEATQPLQVVQAEATTPVQAAVKPKVQEEETVTHAQALEAKEAVTEEIAQHAATQAQLQYIYPSIEFLREGRPATGDARQEISTNVERLSAALSSFGVDANIVNVTRGPSITRYELEIEAGVKLNKLTNLSDDLALSLGASSVWIAPIPDKIATVGVEVPNKSVSIVALREVLESEAFTKTEQKLSFALGKDISGNCLVGNIAKLPHLLIAGTTGSGKSVTMNSLILSILYKAKPDEVKLIMVDPKMVEFGAYNGIPHLLIPVVTDPKKAAGALQWGVTEMLKRYKLFSEVGARDLESYNQNAREREDLEEFAQIVVVIDELADLMVVAKKEVEESICRIAQMGRAAGIHLVIATQRPSADVITGLMKANIPSRIALSVATGLDSRIIMDTMGAEQLVGNGDMLYKPIGANKPIRIQGTYVSEEERETVITHLKEHATPQYDDSVGNFIESAAQDPKEAVKANESAKEHEYDEMFGDAARILIDLGQASVSVLQRKLKLGYSRAARLMDQLEEAGVVGPFEGSKPRQVLLSRAEWQAMQSEGEMPEATDDSFEHIPKDDFSDLEAVQEEEV